MSRVEDFSAEVVSPELLRDICAIVSNVGKKCVLTSAQPTMDSQPVEEEESISSVLSLQNTFQLWVHLSSNNMFNDFDLHNAESIELSADTLAQAFQNEAGVMSMTEVKMRISHKVGRLPNTIDANTSQTVPQSHRLISFHMSNKTIDGTATKVVEQRIYAEYLSPDLVMTEPSIEGVQDWADPSTYQLAQMAKVCEQYKQMSDRVKITISALGMMTLKSEAADVVATTTWRVEKAERANATQEVESHPEEPLFVEDDGGNERMSHQGIRRDECSCVVLVKDWQIVSQARKMCRRVVIGVLNERCLVAYGFLKQGRHSSAQDVATFYLWHQS